MTYTKTIVIVSRNKIFFADLKQFEDLLQVKSRRVEGMFFIDHYSVLTY